MQDNKGVQGMQRVQGYMGYLKVQGVQRAQGAQRCRGCRNIRMNSCSYSQKSFLNGRAGGARDLDLATASIKLMLSA